MLKFIENSPHKQNHRSLLMFKFLVWCQQLFNLHALKIENIENRPRKQNYRGRLLFKTAICNGETGANGRPRLKLDTEHVVAN